MPNQVISLTQKYPPQNFNLLGNTDVVAQIPEIMSPVVQAIKLSPNPNDGDVYPQGKNLSITKNGLKKLADGAGIKMISSEHVIPNTCQKCVAVNAHRGQVVQCGNCNNKDIAYHVTISVPQLTGEILTVEDTHEIIVEEVTKDMSDKQRGEFMKHLPQICEAKALNGAIRTALHIKGTYTVQELQKPFIVAYLVPNLNHQDIKEAAINNLFESKTHLFGKPKPLEVSQIESRVPDVAMIEASDGENYDQYVDGTYQTVDQVPDQYYQPPQQMEPVQNMAHVQNQQPVYYQAPPQQQQQSQNYFPPAQPNQPAQHGMSYQCAGCGAAINVKVFNYSINKFGRALCYNCQQAQRGGR